MKKIALLVTDLFSLYASLAALLTVRYSDQFREQWSNHFIPFSLIFAMWVLIFYIANLYDISALRRGVHFYQNFFQGVTFAAILSVTCFYLIPLFGITPKTNLFIFLIFVSGVGIGMRLLFRYLSERSFQKPILIVGINPQSLEIAQFIIANPQLGYELKACIDTDTSPAPEHTTLPIVHGVAHIDRLITEHRINTVVISPEALHEASMINTFYRSLGQKVTFKSLSSFYEQTTNRVPLGAINQVWFLENLSEGSKHAFEMAKRVLDITTAIFLGVLTVPFFPLIALVIRLSSVGPIFYRQKRLGRAGHTFSIIKFRTMKDRAEQDTGAVWASENDPRVTSVGKFLRKTRIDELPQLWNILRGEMSFVGPRAERPEFYEKLRASVPFYEERYLIKPGLTGWAQINYPYGASIQDAAFKLQYDLYYIKNRSLVLDVGVILKTINIAFRQAGR